MLIKNVKNCFDNSEGRTSFRDSKVIKAIKKVYLTYNNEVSSKVFGRVGKGVIPKWVHQVLSYRNKYLFKTLVGVC